MDTKPEEGKDVTIEKPKVKVVSVDGRAERKKRAVDIGLSDLILPPWTRGVTAVYKILSSTRIDPATKQEAEVKDVLMPGSYMLYDKFEPDPLKKNKLMRNLGRPSISRDKTTGKEVIDEQIVDIEFIAGVVKVDIDKDFRKYVFMELHPLNRTNRHRSNDNAPYFERTDLKYNKSDMYLANEMDLGRDAEELVMKMKDKNEIIGMAVSAGVYQNGLDPGALKVALRQFARNSPKAFYKLTSNAAPGIRLSLLDALNWGIIAHDTDARKFILVENMQTIFTYAINEDPVDSLVDNMMKKENAQVINNIVAMVDYWE